ncbi:MAG: hypothetical protein QW156_03825 [Candidatus Aenigmatarchaeota archaeon]
MTEIRYELNLPLWEDYEEREFLEYMLERLNCWEKEANRRYYYNYDHTTGTLYRVLVEEGGIMVIITSPIQDERFIYTSREDIARIRQHLHIS